MNRRGFLAGMLALGCAPAIVRADSLMRIVPRGTSLLLTGEIGSVDGLRFVVDGEQVAGVGRVWVLGGGVRLIEELVSQRVAQQFRAVMPKHEWLAFSQ